MNNDGPRGGGGGGAAGAAGVRQRPMPAYKQAKGKRIVVNTTPGSEVNLAIF